MCIYTNMKKEKINEFVDQSNIFKEDAYKMKIDSPVTQTVTNFEPK